MRYSPPIERLGAPANAPAMFEALLGTFDNHPAKRLVRLGGVIISGTNYSRLARQDSTGIFTAARPLVELLDPYRFKQTPKDFHTRVGVYLHRGDAFNDGFDVRNWHKDGIISDDRVAIITDSEPTEELVGDYRQKRSGLIVRHKSAQVRPLEAGVAYELRGSNVHRRPAEITSADRIFAAVTLNTVSLESVQTGLDYEPSISIEFPAEGNFAELLDDTQV